MVTLREQPDTRRTDHATPQPERKALGRGFQRVRVVAKEAETTDRFGRQNFLSRFFGPPRFSRLARTRNLFPFFAHYLVFISCMERLQLASPPGQRIERLVPPLPQIFRKPRTTPLGPFYRLRRPPILPFADRTRVPRGLGHPPKFSRRRAEQLCLHKTGNVPVPQKRRDAVDVRS